MLDQYKESLPQRVLLLDDEDIITELVKSLLSDLGITNVDAVHDVPAALDQVSKADPPYDLVFSDLILPQQDGVDFISGLADIGYGGRLFVLSGQNRHDIDAAVELARAFDLNIDAQLRKPVALKDLIPALLPDEGPVVHAAILKEVSRPAG